MNNLIANDSMECAAIALNSFMDNGISDIVDTIGRFYLGSAKGVGFLAHLGLSARRAMRTRADYEKKGSHAMTLDRAGQERLMGRIEALQASGRFKGINLLAFPGPEDYMGGCLAAGRGFFHISQAGAAEPCPFSPFSVANVAETGLLAVLKSPFFKKVQEVEAAHAAEHKGGCTLFQHQDEVRRALAAAEKELSES